ncbi:hypothetical protein RT717_07175 [Imperialibacter roseus]|uniref:Uncharacterized protein n=1 Tax=Imperialibacter roseus TaxID=1324217 RepID=A0ABZ0ITQ6_9BACT|nr:hypothetical protein [Imperialibacter roseus]WOK08418.1 hypothetical protein RT717_07175 [Imperialibacter roseus]
MMASVRHLFKKGTENTLLLLCVAAAILGFSGIEAATPTRPFTPVTSEVAYSPVSVTHRSFSYARAILDLRSSASTDFKSQRTLLNIATLLHERLASTLEQVNAQAPLVCLAAVVKKHLPPSTDEDSSIHS